MRFRRRVSTVYGTSVRIGGGCLWEAEGIYRIRTKTVGEDNTLQPDSVRECENDNNQAKTIVRLHRVPQITEYVYYNNIATRIQAFWDLI